MDPITLSILIGTGMQLAGMGADMYFSKGRQKDAEAAAQRIAAQQRMLRERDMVSGLQVPTLGAELARQELGQQFATSLDTLSQSGAAGVLGGITGLAGLASDKALDIMADLNLKQAQRDQFVASQLQQQQQREVASQRILLGQQLQGAQMAAAQEKAQQRQDIAGMVGAVGKGVSQYIGAQDLYKTEQPGADITSTVAKPAEQPGYAKYAEPLSTTAAQSKYGTLEDRAMKMPEIGGFSPEQFLGLPNAGVPSANIQPLYQQMPSYPNALKTPKIGGQYTPSEFLPLGIPGLTPITFS